MPFIRGQRIIDAARNWGTERTKGEVLRIWGELLEYGYTARQSVTPSGWSQAHHVSRITRRWRILSRYIPPSLLHSPEIRVGDRKIAGVTTMPATLGWPSVTLNGLVCWKSLKLLISDSHHITFIAQR